MLTWAFDWWYIVHFEYPVTGQSFYGYGDTNLADDNPLRYLTITSEIGPADPVEDRCWPETSVNYQGICPSFSSAWGSEKFGDLGRIKGMTINAKTKFGLEVYNRNAPDPFASWLYVHINNECTLGRPYCNSINGACAFGFEASPHVSGDCFKPTCKDETVEGSEECEFKSG